MTLKIWLSFDSVSIKSDTIQLSVPGTWMAIAVWQRSPSALLVFDIIYKMQTKQTSACINPFYLQHPPTSICKSTTFSHKRHLTACYVTTKSTHLSATIIAGQIIYNIYMPVQECQTIMDFVQHKMMEMAVVRNQKYELCASSFLHPLWLQKGKGHHCRFSKW